MMRAAVVLGLLVASGTGIGFTLDPEPLTVTGAIILMGMAVCLILAGIAMGVYIERIKAAARREALLEAEECPSDEWGITWQSRARRLTAEVKRLRAKVARVETLADEWALRASENAALTMRHITEVLVALAEPERDEEGGP